VIKGIFWAKLGWVIPKGHPHVGLFQGKPSRLLFLAGDDCETESARLSGGINWAKWGAYEKRDTPFNKQALNLGCYFARFWGHQGPGGG